MNIHLEKALHSRAPSLYQHTYIEECDDGWFMILWRLTEKLVEYNVKATQIKEKYGALRFYFDATNEERYEEVRQIVENAENESVQTCEVCGRPGEIRPTSWIKTLCEEHYEQFQKTSKRK